MRVEQLMTTQVAAVRPETPLKDVAQLLVARGISGVPVCRADGGIVGVVSETDIVAHADSVPVQPPGALGWLLAADAAPVARTAGEAMTSPPIVVEPGRPIAEAARLMTAARINRLPVVFGGRLVGILTRGDLVAAFARGDGEIAREIYHDVLLQTLSIGPEVVEVSVVDGRVALRGEVEARSEAELIAVFVGRVPGVVEVDASGLGWRGDDLDPAAAEPEASPLG